MFRLEHSWDDHDTITIYTLYCNAIITYTRTQELQNLTGVTRGQYLSRQDGSSFRAMSQNLDGERSVVNHADSSAFGFMERVRLPVGLPILDQRIE
jgi:hypothetical protein